MRIIGMGIVMGAAALAGLGCGHESLQVSTARDVRGEMLEMQPTQRKELPPAIADFHAEVRKLADSKETPQHQATVRALRHMAEAVRALGSDGRAADSIEQQASIIEGSPSPHYVRSEATKWALKEATKALEAASKEKSVPGWQDRINSARDAVDAIDEQTLYPEQRSAIDRAFVDVADAMVVGTAPSPSAAREALGETNKSAKIERWLFDQRGQRPNVEAMCGGPAKSVTLDRTPGDATAAFFTFGFYTPVHVRATCPTRAFNTAKR